MKLIGKLNAAQYDLLLKAYKLFFNQSDVFIINKSIIKNHRLATRRGSLLVINLDLSEYLKYSDAHHAYPNISLQLRDCKLGIESLNRISKDIEIFLDEERGRYLFTNGTVDVYIPQLNAREIDNHIYDIDLPSINKPGNKLYAVKDYGFLLIAHDQFKADAIIKCFSKTPYVDILIKNGAVGGLQYKDIKIRLQDEIDQGISIDRHEADIILRSYNLIYFKDKARDITISVFKNYDGIYWLVTQANFLYDHNKTIKEEGPVPWQYDFTCYEAIDLVAT
jgi:hypothetical protein